MAPTIPPIDPERLHELKIAKLSDEGKEILDALQGCQNLAEKIVVITGTRHGLTGCAEYLRHANVDRQQCYDAADALKAVGLVNEAMMCRLVAKTKPKPHPPWRQRQSKHMLERVKMLRAKGSLPPYQP
jgi:hypothetical protein